MQFPRICAGDGAEGRKKPLRPGSALRAGPRKGGGKSERCHCAPYARSGSRPGKAVPPQSATASVISFRIRWFTALLLTGGSLSAARSARLASGFAMRSSAT